MREIELQIIELRTAIEQKEAAVSDPTIEHWLIAIRDQFRHLF
jgi:hypothetical protein